MGHDYTVAHAAALAAHLPRESATVRAERPDAEWDEGTYLLAAIEYDLRYLAWLNSEDGAKGRRRPKPMETPADRARVREKAERTDLEFVSKVLGMTIGGDE